MQISRVAYDKFEMQLPAAEPGWEPLTEGCIAREVASWLWQFGPTPLIAVVEHAGKKPKWVNSRLAIDVPWNGRLAAAVLIETEKDLESFLAEGAPHRETHFMWPRRSPAKAFEAMCSGKWQDEVEGHANVSPTGSVEVLQLQPA